MHPAIRTQVDGKFYEYSLETGLKFDGPDAEDQVRPEHADETDINTIVGRFGLGAQQKPEAIYTEFDFDTDLQQALDAVSAAKRVHQRLPASLREKYPSWRSLLNALNEQELRLDLSLDAEEKLTRKPDKDPDPKPPA